MFEGKFEMQLPDGTLKKESLDLENTLWASTVVASGKILAMVIYTGSEMRIVLNSRSPRSKVGKLENELNFLSKILFLIMCGLAFLIIGFIGFGQWFFTITLLVRFIVLFCSIIPISLRVNLDFAKLVYSFLINSDKKIEGSLARNRTIPEELGRIQFLLTDKTGTLTKNEMIFKKISFEFGCYDSEKIEHLKRIITKQSKKHKGPLADVETRLNQDPNSRDLSRKIHKIKREKDSIIRDLVTALVVCHNVTPVFDNGERTFQASSPDEIALVKIGESLGMKLISRDQNEIIVENADGYLEKYTILANFPFSSERKRMGIILKFHERIIFYLKGADTIMKEKVSLIFI